MMMRGKKKGGNKKQTMTSCAIRKGIVCDFHVAEAVEGRGTGVGARKAVGGDADAAVARELGAVHGGVARGAEERAAHEAEHVCALLVALGARVAAPLRCCRRGSCGRLGCGHGRRRRRGRWWRWRRRGSRLGRSHTGSGRTRLNRACATLPGCWH